MHGLVALDSQQRVLRPAILWNDQRTAAECAEIEERLGLERLIALTGNRALPGFTAPKLLWVRRHEPEVYERIAHVLLPKDYVRLKLFGELTSDAADASGTLLFDVERRRWSGGGKGFFFAPSLVGGGPPHADPNARAAFVGLSLRHDRGALVRAVMEGVAYGLRDSLELLRGLGCVAERARISGGGARSALWTKIVASVLGIPLERTAVEEGAAYGAALLGGVAAGVFADVHEAGAACVRVRDRIEPNEAWRETYEAG